MKLLIGYDGSECAGAAIDDLRRAGLPEEGVEAVVMAIADVWPDPPAVEFMEFYPIAAERVQVQFAAAMDEAKRLAGEGRERVAALFPRWKVVAEPIADSPYWGLVKKASDWRADLLAVGSHGRSAVGRLVFGSVSHSAALYADCSVRISRGTQQARGGDGVRLLLGWDGSEDAAMAARALSARSWPAGSACRIVTAFDARLASLLPPEKLQGLADERERLHRAAGEVAAELRGKGLAVDDPAVIDGDPKRVLLHEAETWKADCIFVGAKGRSRIERVLLGSVSSAVTVRASCTVEVVRERTAKA